MIKQLDHHQHSAGFKGVYGGSGYGIRNQDGLCILDFCVANKLAITNTLFCKNKSRLITFSTGGNHTQVDFILVRTPQLKNIKDIKLIIAQHKLLFGDLVVSAKPVKPHQYSTRKENLEVER